MSVDDIQKVNKLAQDLLNQGICSDRQEAVKKAEEMLNKNLAKNVEPSAVASSEDDNFKMLFDRFKDYTQKQMQVFRNDLQCLNDQIKSLKSQLHSRPKPVVKQAENSDNPQTTIKEDDDKPHPKRGNTKSEDVCIEKMFYYGNK